MIACFQQVQTVPGLCRVSVKSGDFVLIPACGWLPSSPPWRWWWFHWNDPRVSLARARSAAPAARWCAHPPEGRKGGHLLWRAAPSLKVLDRVWRSSEEQICPVNTAENFLNRDWLASEPLGQTSLDIFILLCKFDWRKTNNTCYLFGTALFTKNPNFMRYCPMRADDLWLSLHNHDLS